MMLEFFAAPCLYAWPFADGAAIFATEARAPTADALE